jgi:hypothetical protein
MSRLIVIVLLIFVVLVPQKAGGEISYGGSVGLGIPLAPFEELGIAGSLSAVRHNLESGPKGVIRLRGEVLGIGSKNGSAIMPILSGDMGLGFGPVDLFLSGGLQIFGFSWRDDYAFFCTLGLLGGGGVGVQITSQFRLQIRGLVAWLPSPTTARIKEPDPKGTIPTMLFVTTLFGLVYTPAESEPL